MTDRPSPRRTATRDRLIEAALGVFAEKGVLAATVEEICDAAGFTRGAFYSNFVSKDALCIAVLDAQAEESLEATREAIASLPDPASLGELTTEELVDSAVGVFMRSQRADRAWVLGSSELRLHAARASSIRAAYRERLERSTRGFVALIEETAAQLGYELVVPGADAIDVLHGVFEHGAIAALIAGEDVAGTVRTAQLGAALRSLLRPTARPA
ncbi:MAG: TetR family transcriptional regulator [Actinobacteria bacterium]|nr:TetR family transcriptional regulator [Actinomycetota bacterium]